MDTVRDERAYVALLHVGAQEAVLPEAVAKPTSSTGQHEATLGVFTAGATATGVWECGPGTFTADRTQQMEVCTILVGSATVTGEGGDVAHLVPGSLLILPVGWRGTWVVEQTVRKTYVLLASTPA